VARTRPFHVEKALADTSLGHLAILARPLDVVGKFVGDFVVHKRYTRPTLPTDRNTTRRSAVLLQKKKTKK